MIRDDRSVAHKLPRIHSVYKRDDPEESSDSPFFSVGQVRRRFSVGCSSRSRGVEALGSVWTFLDLTPLGRQEEWEDSPSGRPQTADGEPRAGLKSIWR